jgi:(p)ppGpp synthase/HD superfamily hydrolase
MASFSQRFDDALAFAHQLHRNQMRKTSGVPYVAHLLGVASLVIEDGGTEDEAIAALLHDSIEDQGRHYPGGPDMLARAIEEKFGPAVLTMVLALTERPTPREQGISDKRARWRAHKEDYYEQVLTASPSVRRISCADSVHNVRTLIKDFTIMGDELWSRFRTRSADDQLWAYDMAARAFEKAGVGQLAQELRRAVDDLHRVVGLPVSN